MLALFTSAFVLAGHDPTPHDLPIGIVAPPAAAGAFGAALDQQEPGGFQVTRYDTEEQARAAIESRDVYGVLVPGSDSDRLLVASGASAAVAGLLQGTFNGRAAATGQPLQVEDIVPLATGDPRGVTLGLVVLPLVIASILGGMLLALLARRAGPVTATTGVLGLAVVGGVALVTPARMVDALPGDLVTLVAVAVLAVLAITAVSRGLIGLVGERAIGVLFLVFLLVGNLGSGANSAPELLPGFWRVLGPFFPPGAATDALRGVAYFDAADIARPLMVLTVWAAVGLTLTLLAARKVATEPEPGPELGPAQSPEVTQKSPEVI